MRILRTHLTWEEWLFRDFVRYWYILGAFALDTFLPWFVADEFALRGGLAIGVVGSLVFTLIYLEFILYLHLWPGGVWRVGRSRKRKRFIPKGLR